LRLLSGAHSFLGAFLPCAFSSGVWRISFATGGDNADAGWGATSSLRAKPGWMTCLCRLGALLLACHGERRGGMGRGLRAPRLL